MSDDIHALSGAYAVDALDDVERARFERHLANCEACRAEVDSLAAAGAELSAMTVTPPPPSLRDAVLRDIKTVRPLPPVSGDVTTVAGDPGDAGPGAEVPGAEVVGAEVPGADSVPGLANRPDRRAPRWSGPWRGLVAAAAAAVLLIGGVTVYRATTQEPRRTVAEQVLAAHDATRVTKDFPGGANAMFVRSPSLHKAVVVTSRMPSPPSGKVYQLWLQDRSGKLTSAGLMPDRADQVVVLDGDAAGATGAGITVEPAGGSAQPTSQPIAFVSFA
ncbi:anti-sigma K factor RskA [Intrasporangium oryzae NRRL B-24470]|uniref:Regulator of SigK n=1 Tax=Intrasporangium oryzae NRRL B-24470 TaxID=1386089 RepID=W9G7V8_9MICO|nr:anti-sigma factor [Intrasporangium oryzae]EWT01357.1 anti-sigma K factor RskA [Intrasporangium oryzae NRRL B-24470]